MAINDVPEFLIHEIKASNVLFDLPDSESALELIASSIKDLSETISKQFVRKAEE